MKSFGLLLSFMFSFCALWAQNKILVDDSLQLTYRNIGRYSISQSEAYFDVSSFRRYRPIPNQFSAFARSGNNGLPSHSYRFSAQDWNSNSMLGGFQPLLFTKDSLRFYTSSRPFTQLSYFNGSKSEQQFSIFHTQNLGEGMNLAFNYRRITSEGFYIRQLATHTQFNASVKLKSRDQRFNTDLYYLINSIENQENGGVVLSDDDSETDNTVLLTINLRNAQNQSKSQDWGAKSTYDLMYTNDSTKEPLLSVSHEFNWLKVSRKYTDNLSESADFYETSIFDEINSNDSSFSQSISNEVLANFWGNKLQLGARNEQLQWFQNYLIQEETSSNFLLAKANLNFAGVHFATAFEKGISGFHENELDWKISAAFNDSVTFQPRLYSRISRKQSDFLLTNQRGNRNYFNANLNTSNQVQIGGAVSHEKYRFTVDVNYRLLTDYVYLDSLQTPQQEGDQISILQVNLRKNFIFLKNFRWNNHFQIQAISNTDVVPLPAFSSFHSLFYDNDFFKNSLNFQLGADFAFIGEYGGYAYSPSLAQFYLRQENAAALGNIIQLDLFMNLRIHKAARIFAKLENITGKPFSEESYRIENYPVPGRVLKLGLSWRMLN